MALIKKVIFWQNEDHTLQIEFPDTDENLKLSPEALQKLGQAMADVVFVTMHVDQFNGYAQLATVDDIKRDFLGQHRTEGGGPPDDSDRATEI
jgi:hypothetical protein